MLHGETSMSNWTLFSNHGHVLVCLSRDSEVRLRDVAADVGITERAVQKIVVICRMAAWSASPRMAAETDTVSTKTNHYATNSKQPVL